MGAVTAFQFAIGDGVTTAFTLMDPSGAVAGAPTVTALYRNDWQGNQLLYTTARTNALPQSQNITAWSLTGTPGRTADAIVAPDGTLTADILDLTSSSVGDGIFQIGVATTATWARSIWLKGAVGGEQVTFSDPVVGGGGIQTLTNQWQRFSYVGVGGAGTGGLWIRKSSGNIIHVWGGQLELGATPTGYLATGAGTTTNTDYVVAGAVATVTPAPIAGATLSWTGTDSNGPFIPGHAGLGTSSSFGGMGVR